MDAKLKKIQVTPTKFDNQGDIQKEEFATVTMEVPMDSEGQREEIISVLDLLNQEWVVLNIDSKPRKPPHGNTD